MIMYPVNLGVGILGGEDMGDPPGITETKDAQPSSVGRIGRLATAASSSLIVYYEEEPGWRLVPEFCFSHRFIIRRANTSASSRDSAILFDDNPFPFG